MTLKQLRAENAALRKIAADLQIYAKRYADGRMTFACAAVNQHTQTLLDLGVPLNPGAEQIIWALDGGGPQFRRDLTKAQQTPGTPEALGVSEKGTIQL